MPVNNDCDVGMMKPDGEINLLACNRLGVLLADYLFIGVGGSRELTGASKVGMDAVLIRAPDDTESGAARTGRARGYRRWSKSSTYL